MSDTNLLVCGDCLAEFSPPVGVVLATAVCPRCTSRRIVTESFILSTIGPDWREQCTSEEEPSGLKPGPEPAVPTSLSRDRVSVLDNEVRAQALVMYRSVDTEVKEDLVQAIEWAQQKLTLHEGSGHIINVTTDTRYPHQLTCQFSKPEWSGEHSGDPRDTASDAIVWAVCTYLCGG